MTEPVPPAAVLAALARLEARIRVLEDTAAHRDERNPADIDHVADVQATSAAAAPAAARAWWWPDLDPTAATAAWEQLDAWVRDALLARHPPWRRGLRPCWRAHPDVVDELTALRLLWLHAHADPQPGPAAAVGYLTRLPVVLARIQAAFKHAGCKTEAGVALHAAEDDRFTPARGTASRSPRSSPPSSPTGAGADPHVAAQGLRSGL